MGFYLFGNCIKVPFELVELVFFKENGNSSAYMYSMQAFVNKSNNTI